jgi:hypothetical protein
MFLFAGLGSTGHHSTVLTICIYIVWLSLTYHGKISPKLFSSMALQLNFDLVMAFRSALP